METFAAVAASAALLGATHALEPDHVAGIAVLASEGSRRRAGVVGACFAVGHAAIVAAWVAVASLAIDRLPVDPLAAVGDAALGVVLLAVGLVTARAGVRTLRGRDHAHAGSALAERFGRPETVRDFLAVGLVGALFTLSPPLSMLAFVTGVLPAAGATGAWLAVAAYAASIVAVMAAVGLAAGGAFAAIRERDRRTHGVGQLVVAGAVGVLGVAVLAV